MEEQKKTKSKPPVVYALALVAAAVWGVNKFIYNARKKS